jgi:hypothetical protein
MEAVGLRALNGPLLQHEGEAGGEQDHDRGDQTDAGHAVVEGAGRGVLGGVTGRIARLWRSGVSCRGPRGSHPPVLAAKSKRFGTVSLRTTQRGCGKIVLLAPQIQPPAEEIMVNNPGIGCVCLNLCFTLTGVGFL